MTSESDTPNDSADQEWDLEQEWSDAREAAGLESRSPAAGGPDEPGDYAEVSPFSLLYTGFLLGPPATLLAALILLGRRIQLRDAFVLVGICGAAWSTIAAATFGLAGDWSVIYLQVLRTSVNFAAGLAAIWYLSRQAHVSFLHDRQTLINTIVLGLLLVLGFTSLPDSMLVWLGR